MPIFDGRDNMTQMVPLKEYKVAYWTGGEVLQSKMFDTLKEAKMFACGLPKTTVYTIMQSKTVGDGSYSWVVLPDGVGGILPKLSWIYSNRKPVGYALGAFVLYKVLR